MSRRTVVSYANSGDMPIGDPGRVVGYGAGAFRRGTAAIDSAALSPVRADAAGTLDAADKKVLLRLARETITRFLRTETVPLPRGGSAKLLRESGAFVTLKSRGDLRGCIGRIQGEGPLIRLIGVLALDSAFRDSRFKPVTADELKHLEIEVSVLTPLSSVPGPDAIQPGRDGSVTHVDGSARIQTITRAENAMYYDLVKEFDRLTGCPVIINTSFNVRGEPIVCTPHDAYLCFMRTNMDQLVLGVPARQAGAAAVERGRGLANPFRAGLRS